MLGAYALMEWASEKYASEFVQDYSGRRANCFGRNEYLNSKPGRMEAAEAGEEV
jgi:hypothetical protein